ncbi:protein KASH5-like [Rhinoraja longicauda]
MSLKCKLFLKREATELINDIECLEYTNRRLMDQGAKLQRTVEGFEEANVRLTEEIFELKTKLKSSQQATQHVKLLENEMEDLKSIIKNLEDKNYTLQTQNRQLEKEHQNLGTSISQLQEENGKLTVEKDNMYCRYDELLFEMAELKNQIYEAKGLISVKDALLSEKINQSEEMKSTVEEYNDIIQRSDVASNNLPTPLCGTLPLHNSARLIKDIMYNSCSQLNWVAFRTIAEELLMQQGIEEETKEFLQKFSHLFYAKVVWDMCKGSLAPQLTEVMQRYQPVRHSCARRCSIKDNEDSMAECVKPKPHLRHIGEELMVVPGATHRAI